jgi:hypothetical protein
MWVDEVGAKAYRQHLRDLMEQIPEGIRP